MLAAATASCSGGKSGAPAPDRNVISRAMMVDHKFVNAYDAVAALRSNWLLVKGIDSHRSPGEVLVYMDNVRLGGVETLRNIPTISIEYIRYFDGVAATSRWGLDHAHGVIFVSSLPERAG